MNKSLFALIIFITFCLSNVLLIAQNIIDNEKPENYNIPDLLISNHGLPIQTSEDWEEIRRPEILDLFETFVYGKIPKENLDIKFNLIKSDSNALSGKAVQKEVMVTLANENDTLKINILIFLPINSNKSHPIFLGMNFYGNHTIHKDTNITITPNYVNNNSEFFITDNQASNLSRGVRANRWPIERILERGYGIATIYYGDLDPDYDDGFLNGVHKLYNSADKKKRNPDEWGSISAWAYGLSKAMDYFYTDNDIDHNQVAVIGHSRLGKTALWAGAVDQRFALVTSNNSGCGGAALSRRKSGETLKDINAKFPHWFCENFHGFKGREEELPIDQHMLIALLAPRPVYVGSALQDKWSDPNGEYLSLFYAGPAYKLYNEETLVSESLPELNQPIITGKLGYHIRSGGHDLTKYDWEKYMDFADINFKSKMKND